uniref:Uncharacterized protein n=1 Tax=viral metagenome TaxID=1070528 RepID=A0A6C0LZL1_9ZZZZ
MEYTRPQVSMLTDAICAGRDVADLMYDTTMIVGSKFGDVIGRGCFAVVFGVVGDDRVAVKYPCGDNVCCDVFQEPTMTETNVVLHSQTLGEAVLADIVERQMPGLVAKVYGAYTREARGTKSQSRSDCSTWSWNAPICLWATRSGIE